MPGTLYIVATPIGNLSDITLRAIETLKAVDLIAAEDTRVTRRLLAHYDIHTPMTPFHAHSLAQKAEALVQFLKDGKSIALVSDAGTPGISDPGHEIIVLAISSNIPVVAIPGPNAIAIALVVSGLPTQRFAFDGFPPRRASGRKKYFGALANERRTMVFYEAPHRLLDTLSDMLSEFGDRRLAVVREATKVFEEVYRGTISGAIDRFTETPPKGEFTIVVAGAPEQSEQAGEEVVEQTLRKLLKDGLSERDAVHAAALTCGLPRKQVYQAMLRMKGEHTDEG